jgi:hypothetical protein
MASRRNKLNAKQIQLLKLLYKFRFVTADLVARHKGISRAAVNYSLAVLVAQDYVGKRYDKNYRLSGKGAVYYLALDGLHLLKQNLNLSENVFHAMRKNNTVGDDFVDGYITIMRVYLALRSTYPDTFNIFTTSELGVFDYFPKPKPSLYLSHRTPTKTKQNDFMLDVIEDNRPFVIKKRLQVYSDHFDSGDWGQEPYPKVLLVCFNAWIESKAQKYIESLLEDFDVYTTSKKALLFSDKDNNQIWSDAFEPEKLFSL